MLHQINFIVLGRSDTEDLDYFRIYVYKYFFRYYLLFKAEKPRASDAHRHDDIALRSTEFLSCKDNDNCYVSKMNVVPFRRVPIILFNIPANV